MIAPFEECSLMQGLRRRAAQLAKTDLPITIAGEPGTGRRTLATALVRSRAEDFVSFNGDAAVLRAAPGRVDLLAHDLDALPVATQRELAALVHDKRVRLVAVAGTTAEPLAPALEVALSSTRLVLPPLSERPGDVGQWALLFLERCPDHVLTSDALRAIRGHRWRGNLIELEMTITRAACLVSGREITAADLELAEDVDPVIKPLEVAIEEFRVAYVMRALAMFEGNRTQTARALHVDPRTIFRYLEQKRER